MKLFYCFAVARSGTSYFGELLNSHRQILCGHERFSPGHLKAGYFTPDGFLDCEPSRVDRKRMEALLAAKPDLMAIGDKFPRGYLHTTNLVAEIPGAHFFAIIRDTRRIAASWNARAKNPSDSWPEGMLSLFADVEFLFLMFALFTLPPEIEFSFVNYEYLVDPKTMEACATDLCALLGVEPDAPMRDFIGGARSYVSRSSGEPARIDEEFYRLPFVEEFLTSSRTWKIESRAMRLRELRTFVAGFRKSESAVAEMLTQAIRDSSSKSSAVEEYLLRVRGLYRKAGKAVRLAQFTKGLLEGAMP